jgi:hypothetical protein
MIGGLSNGGLDGCNVAEWAVTDVVELQRRGGCCSVEEPVGAESVEEVTLMPPPRVPGWGTVLLEAECD